LLPSVKVRLKESVRKPALLTQCIEGNIWTALQIKERTFAALPYRFVTLNTSNTARVL